VDRRAMIRPFQIRGRSMGVCGSCCNRNEEPFGGDSQYESLVLTKPPPITLYDIKAEADDKMDGVPLFAPAKEDDGWPVGSDPDSLTDQELNIYAAKLPESD
jgi:hypothetical protein